MTPRHRFRRWRYRRYFAREFGYEPEHARLMASICASLDVAPQVIGGAVPGLNHWATWGAVHPGVPVCFHPDWEALADAGFTQADAPPHTVWFDRSPLLDTDLPADGG